MNKRDFFMNAVKNGNLKRKFWILRAFSIVLSTKNNEPTPWGIVYIKDTSGIVNDIQFYDGDSNPITLDDYGFNVKEPEPPFKFAESITLKEGELENVFKTTKTTYGNVLANWLWIVFPFGNRIEFITGVFTVSDVEDKIEPLLTSIPEDPDAKRDPKLIYVDDHWKFQRVKGLFDGLSQLCVPSATAKALTHHADRDKVLKQLVEENKDNLTDPSVAAMIDSKLIELDKEHIKGDDSEGFYIKSKTVKISRKKLHGVIGLEQAFSDVGIKPQYIDRSLYDGIDRTRFAAVVNNAWEGSFDRGFQTQLGGKGTKDILKLLQNATITMDDCGSKLGIETAITKADKKSLLYNTFIINGKLVRLTEENYDKYIGTTQVMRTTGYCKAGTPNFCKTCIGGRYENHETGLATAGAAVTTKFMLIFMKSAHGTALETVEYDYELELT